MSSTIVIATNEPLITDIATIALLAGGCRGFAQVESISPQYAEKLLGGLGKDSAAALIDIDGFELEADLVIKRIRAAGYKGLVVITSLRIISAERRSQLVATGCDAAFTDVSAAIRFILERLQSP